MNEDIKQMKIRKDNAYWERNQLVAVLSKMFPSHLAKHPETDEEWDPKWRTIVVIYTYAEDAADIRNLQNNQSVEIMGRPFYQLTWHIHDNDVPMFDHLTYRTILNDNNYGGMGRDSYLLAEEAFAWDGHSTEEKYRRLRVLPNGIYATLPDELRHNTTVAREDGITQGQLNVIKAINGVGHSASLKDLEQLGVITEDTQKAPGYPKSVNNRMVMDNVIKTVVDHYLEQIKNTKAGDREGQDMAGEYDPHHDPRVARI